MTTPGQDGTDTWQGLAVLDADHQPLGRIDDVYRDRATGQPEWMLVHSETSDAPAVFVPVHRASKEGDAVVVPYDRGLVERAPGVPPTSQLSEADEARLYDHYGISYSAEESPSGLPADNPSGEGGEVLTSDHPTTEPQRSGRSTAVKAAAPAAGLVAAGAVGAVLLRRRRQQQQLTPLQRAVEQVTRAARQVPRGPVTSRTAMVRRRIRRQAPGKLGRAMTSAVVMAARTGYKTGTASANTRNRATGGARQAQRMLGQGRKAARRAASYGARNVRLTARTAARSTGATVKSTGASVRSAASRASDRAPSPRRRGSSSSSRKSSGGLGRRRAKMRRNLRAGALAGMAIGYVLGSRAGRERYEALIAAARAVAAQPSVDRLKSELTGLARAQLDRANAAVGDAGGRAADRVGKTRESVSKQTDQTSGSTGTETPTS